MALLSVLYDGAKMSSALPKSPRGERVRVFLSEMGGDIENAVMQKLLNQDIIKVEKLGTLGHEPINGNARGRGAIEATLEFVTYQSYTSEQLMEVAELMRSAIKELFATPRYSGGNYDDLEIVVAVLPLGGVIVSKD